jgi:hypothetical protein
MVYTLYLKGTDILDKVLYSDEAQFYLSAHIKAKTAEFGALNIHTPSNKGCYSP